MKKNALKAFSDAEFNLAKDLLAAKVATMLGRKMEEGDWDFVYCNAKKIPTSDWSNLHIDIVHEGLGVEHKMLCCRKKGALKNLCGTTLMHPSATRSIRIKNINAAPNDACKDILTQYGELITTRTQSVLDKSDTQTADMRIGWLLWRESLDEFLYFEEKMEIPTPDDYYADWHENPAKGARKATKSLWIYEKDTNKKRFSVTTTAGAKIQPYFDVPASNDENLYYFKVQGILEDDNLVKVWITRSTAKYLETLIGSLDTDDLSDAILKTNLEKEESDKGEFISPQDLATPVIVRLEAYDYLKKHIKYVSDEYLFQQLALNFK